MPKDQYATMPVLPIIDQNSDVRVDTFLHSNSSPGTKHIVTS